MVKRIQKFTGRTTGVAAVLMTIALTTPAIANAGPVSCAVCIDCVATFCWFWYICLICVAPCCLCPVPGI